MTNMMDLYQKKYCILKRKCEELHQTNEKLVNRIHHVKRVLKRYKKERRMLVDQLDGHSDDFHDTDAPLMFEDGVDIKQEVVETSEMPEQDASLPEQEVLRPVSSSDVVTMETDTSPSLTSPSTSTRAVPLGR